MMKMTQKWKNVSLAAVLTGLVGWPISQLAASDHDDRQGRGVEGANPSDLVLGKTYGEWSGIFWQWAYANGFPDSGPFADGEIDCAGGQRGPVWFLTGMGAEDCCDTLPSELPADRICIDPIPQSKRLFFPLINATIHNPDSWCPAEEPDDGDADNNLCTVEEKRQILDALFSDFEPGPVNSRACFLSAYVDGVPVIYDGTLILRTQSPTYAVVADPEAVADGIYVMLPRLSEGQHTIDFTGAICAFDGNNDAENILFGSRVRYQLTIGEEDDDDDETDD